MQPTTPTDFNAIEQPTMLDESRFANDNKLYVEFYRRPMLHAGKSREAGRAVYEERDCIKIFVPGDKLSVIDRPLDEIDRARFADKYQKWLAGQADAVVGTPLSALPGMTPAKIEEYKYFKIMTVEMLAEANDGLGQKFMSFQADKQRAKAFIEVAKGNAPVEQLQAEIDKERAARLEAAAQMEQLQAEMSALKAALGKKSKATAEAAEG